MITYVNKANSNKYSFLYQRATEDLLTHDTDGNLLSASEKGSAQAAISYQTDPETHEYLRDEDGNIVVEADISSLDEYFSHITTLAAISRRYTILPLDEDVFEINANTRVITVPENFAKYGISVQGDEVSEIIYFRVNRFYDATDLATQDIYIQWQTTEKDANGDFVTGFSVPWVIDIESDPGYVIFGWALSSDITKVAGEVQFSVRFYTYTDNKLVYSLSTLTQTAVIKPALDFDIVKTKLAMTGAPFDETLPSVSDPSGMILGRLVDTELLDAGTTVAGDPEIEADVELQVDVHADTSDYEIFYKNLDTDPDTGKTSVTVREVMRAISPDAGKLSYRWVMFNVDTGAALDTDAYRSGIEMQLTADTTPKEGKIYYQKNPNYVEGGTASAFIEYSVDENHPMTGDDAPADGVWERVAVIYLEGVGKYRCTITNRVKNKTAKVITKTLVVPRPVLPVIADNGQPAEHKYLAEADTYRSTLTVTATPGAQEPAPGVLSYQWQISTDNGQTWTDIPDATEASYVINGAAGLVDDADASKGRIGDGLYHVVITNYLNRDTKQITSNYSRVTHEASAPQVQIISEQSYTLNKDIGQRGRVFEVAGTVKPDAGEVRTSADTITYQWYKYDQATSANAQDDFDKAQRGEYTFNGDLEIPDATEATYKPTRAGWYYCIVTNTYNGKSASAYSAFMTAVPDESTLTTEG